MLVHPNNLPEEDRRMFMALGFGRSLPFWKDVILLQLRRLEELEARFPAVRDHFADNVTVYAGNNPVMNQWNLEVQADAHFLLVSIQHVLRLGRRLQNITRASDTRARSLRRGFLSKYRDAEKLRDILEHFDEYSVAGKADRERGIGPDLYGFHVEYDGNSVLLVMGTRQVALVTLGRAAAELAVGLDALWAELVFQRPGAQAESD
jgi:hypothetical protein